MSRSKNPYDTAIYVRVKRHQMTYFVLCDEYEEIGAFKNRLISIFEQTQSLPFKFEDKMTVDDIRLYHKNRVHFIFLI